MTTADAINLINSPRIPATGLQHWADLGSGDGLFSRAILSLLPTGSTVSAIDKSPVRSTGRGINFFQLDFVNDALPLADLDGLLMINSLHFVPDKLSLLNKVRTCLKPNGIFILGEYQLTQRNPFVPFPVTEEAAISLFLEAGFSGGEKISEHPSVFNNSKIYTLLFHKA